MSERTIGIEIELSDIQTFEAAKIVYEHQGLDPSTWIDRYGPYAKPKITYDRWNVMSDGSLYNTDGSRCMWTYMSDGQLVKANASRKSLDRYRWLGAELVSPAVTDVQSLFNDMNVLIPRLVDSGAVMKRELYDSLHVHVDVSDVEFDVIRRWPRRLKQIQDVVSELGTFWRKRSFFTEEDCDRLDAANDELEYWQAYCTVLSRGKVQKKYGDYDLVRRAIDISPRLNPNKPYNTIEFRCFSASKSVEFMSSCVLLSKSIVSSLLENRDLSWVGTQVQQIKEMYE